MHLAKDGFHWVKLRPEGLEQVHTEANPGLAPLGMWSGIPQGFALLCYCGDAVLHKFYTASAEADDKEFGLARLKVQEEKKPKMPKNSKSTVCVPSDCIFMPTCLLCINVFGVPGGNSLLLQ